MIQNENIFSYRKELRTIFSLFVPIFIVQMSLMGISITNTKIVAFLGATAIAAVGLSTAILTTFSTFSYTLLSPISIMISHGIGEEDAKRVREIFHQGLWTANITAFILFFLFFFSEYTIFPLFTTFYKNINQDILSYMEVYLTAISFIFIPYLNTIIFRGFLEAHKKTRITLYITILSFFINLVTAYYLSYGIPGLFEGLGIMGVSISLAFSYTFRVIFLFFYIKKLKLYEISMFSNFSFSKPIIKKTIRIGLPLAITFGIETSILTGVNYLLIPFGVYTISGAQIAQNVWATFFQIPFAINTILGLRISYYLGRKAYKDVIKIVHLGLAIAFINATFESILIYAFKEKIANFYTHDPMILVQANLFISFIALVMIPDSFQSVLSAIQKAHNDTIFPLFVYLSSYLIVLPIAYCYTFGIGSFPKIGPHSLYMGFTVSLTLVSFFLYKRYQYIRSKYNDPVFMKKITSKE